MQNVSFFDWGNQFVETTRQEKTEIKLIIFLIFCVRSKITSSFLPLKTILLFLYLQELVAKILASFFVSHLCLSCCFVKLSTWDGPQYYRYNHQWDSTLTSASRNIKIQVQVSGSTRCFKAVLVAVKYWFGPKMLKFSLLMGPGVSNMAGQLANTLKSLICQFLERLLLPFIVF